VVVAAVVVLLGLMRAAVMPPVVGVAAAMQMVLVPFDWPVLVCLLGERCHYHRVVSLVRPSWR